MGFKALGLETFAVESESEALAALRKLTRESNDYAIIYIEENLASALEHEIARYKDNPTPAIILIPGREGSLGLGQSALRAAPWSVPSARTSSAIKAKYDSLF